MRDLDELFEALAGNRFRRRFRLRAEDAAYLAARPWDVTLQHARQFVLERLAPARPRHDGRQTPWRGHPVFVAQHATGTCCRGCLAKWHRIPAGAPLTEGEIDYVVAVLARWLRSQGEAAPDVRPLGSRPQGGWLPGFEDAAD